MGLINHPMRILSGSSVRYQRNTNGDRRNAPWIQIYLGAQSLTLQK
jgi:hypothetical protein